jgi:RNA polymerase sigma-70 factor, ECF subfamily
MAASVVHLVPDPVDLASLVNRARAGSRVDRHRLVVRVSPRVTSVLRRTLGPDVELADLAQDSLAEFLRGLPRLREPTQVDSFAERIAVNLARSMLRRRALKRLLGFGSSPQPEDEPESKVSAESVDFEARAAVRDLYSALDRLSTELRLAFVLRHIEQHSLDEVAGLLGVSLATAKRRLSKAEHHLDAVSPALTAWLERDP